MRVSESIEAFYCIFVHIQKDFIIINSFVFAILNLGNQDKFPAGEPDVKLDVVENKLDNGHDSFVNREHALDLRVPLKAQIEVLEEVLIS